MNNIRSEQYAALIIRLSLGIMFLAHAGLKYFSFTLAGTAGYFESLGLPGAIAYVTFVAELAVGMMLVSGFYARWAAAAAIPILAGTILFVHGSAGWLFSNPGGGWEYPAFLMAASAAQILLGDGAYALRRGLTVSVIGGGDDIHPQRRTAKSALVEH